MNTGMAYLPTQASSTVCGEQFVFIVLQYADKHLIFSVFTSADSRRRDDLS